MIEALLSLVSTIVSSIGAKIVDMVRDKGLRDHGRIEQQAVDLQSAVAEDRNAQIIHDDVRRMSDADLDSELRGKSGA